MGTPTLREGSGRLGPVFTDNGNFIIDLDLGVMEDPYEVEAELRAIPGLLETGLFLDLADEAIVGLKNGRVKHLRPRAQG